MTKREMTRRKTYVTVASRGGGWWSADVPEIGHTTQARRLDQVEYMVRDLIALVEDVPADSFDVAVRVELASLPAAVSAAQEARKAADESHERAMAATRVAVIELRDRGLPMRDIGNLLGMTHQRVSQLIAAEDGAAREASRPG